ncbi:hypothetical protein EV143_103340 [Flavobacterium chryseum]|uniref:hypothetical protein n=1 Tax=Flavobacterium sp. P3160 TaxID=2512113 RepID=UPI00105C1D53|nr:hypothetical protein [Flavobacterium sp. P3160]TDO78095.1 hypothetical protein EV143_103340 [Flavobacterium sp. P3160]
MDRKHKITIPEPCHEDWNKMTPDKNGRFCLSCSKTVVDFTLMFSDEIKHFFTQNENNKICGRFKKSQLDTITIQIPNRVLYSQTRYSKMFLLALFVAMGTTLFSCADKEGNKKKIDKVEIVKDTASVENFTKGKSLIRDSNVPPPPPKVDQVKFVKPVSKNCSKPINDKVKSSSQGEEDNSTFVTGAVMQTNAEFPGGIEQFYNFFGKEFKKPEDIYASNLKIIISFAVEKNGSMSYLQSEPAIDKQLEDEIIRVLKSCPKWEPGQSNGKKIKMQYSLPIVLQ